MARLICHSRIPKWTSFLAPVWVYSRAQTYQSGDEERKVICRIKLLTVQANCDRSGLDDTGDPVPDPKYIAPP